ncbi:glycosyltransferase [Holdemania massiliensis]|uniref:glycosyltransferase n=1 Tax=Holdemania massiliensis TaxID=1468449 RepID=UPI001F053286|nr:glycosyltransferase [Holdemania massiliensis]MCH1940970.1 glycosyltransferase [Holdemania massiliensis]
MKYDIVFLARIIPKEIEGEVRQKMVGLMEDAAIAWQNHLIEGIEANNDSSVKILNYLPVNSYPETYKDPIIRRLKFSHVPGALDVNLGYVNIKYIKRFFQWIPLRSELKKWVKRDNGKKKVLIAYTMYPEFLGAFQWVKKVHPEIITMNVVVDMPQFTVLGNRKISFLNHIYRKWSDNKANASMTSIDGVVAITKQMAEVLAKDKPYQIIEGLCTHEFSNVNSKKDEDKRIFIYAGMLHEKFGVKDLLDAFGRMQNQNVKLKLCGIGELAQEIINRAKKDNRIEFLGRLTREEVLNELLQADVIVNPRKNVGEFTKYSFPSKNLEALSSGIPFVGYKLAGIPDDYDMYINYPNDDSIEALTAKMVDIIQKYEQYKKRAESAKTWVIENKNCVAQGKKVLDLIEMIDCKVNR